MKNRILTFIIGILVGAIVATAGFLIYSKSINKNVNPNERMPMQQNGEMGEPPEKPGEDFRPTMQNNNWWVKHKLQFI